MLSLSVFCPSFASSLWFSYPSGVGVVSFRVALPLFRSKCPDRLRSLCPRPRRARRLWSHLRPGCRAPPQSLVLPAFRGPKPRRFFVANIRGNFRGNATGLQGRGRDCIFLLFHRWRRSESRNDGSSSAWACFYCRASCQHHTSSDSTSDLKRCNRFSYRQDSAGFVDM